MTYPFDHAIRRPLPHTQPPPQAADGLVVVAVDPRRGTPGEDQLLALCQGALRVMTGEEEAKQY